MKLLKFFKSNTLFLILGILSLFLAYSAWYKKNHWVDQPLVLELPSKAHPEKSSAVNSKGRSPSKKTEKEPHPEPSRPLETGTLDLSTKLGSLTEIQFNSEGYISSVEGVKESKSRLRSSEESRFQTVDREQVSRRAHEIIESIRFELGLQESAPLGKPRFNLGPHSAQVFYQQTFQGYPIEPFGQIKVSLGSRGELLHLDSDYVRELKLSNEIRLSEEEADAKVKAVVSEKNVDPDFKKGRIIIWVPQTSSNRQAALGQYAFEYFSNGFQIVLSASDGSVLAKVPKKIF